MYKSNVNCKVLKSQLDFLVKMGLVEERILRREKIVYAITPKGISTLKAFTEIKQMFPNDENKVRQIPLLILNPISLLQLNINTT